MTPIPSTQKFTCIFCNGSFLITPDAIGKRVACPWCRIPNSIPTSPPPIPASNSEDTSKPRSPEALKLLPAPTDGFQIGTTILISVGAAILFNSIFMDTSVAVPFWEPGLPLRVHNFALAHMQMIGVVIGIVAIGIGVLVKAIRR